MTKPPIMTSEQRIALGCRIGWLRDQGLTWKEAAEIIYRETGRRYKRTRLWMLETEAKNQVHELEEHSVRVSAA